MCLLNRKYAFSITNLPIELQICYRHRSDTDTATTEGDVTCGGLGKFEYSGKALPHALLHMPELVMRGGHHGAFCTFLNEVAHKDSIKTAAKLARTYGSLNISQAKMLELVLNQEIYRAAIKQSAVSHKMREDSSTDDTDEPTATATRDTTSLSLTHKLAHMNEWWRIRGEPSYRWESTMISKKVRVTQGEVLKLLCRKLEINQDRAGRARVLQQLTWECFGSAVQWCDTFKRKFVGISPESPNRRDFVRIKAPSPSRTCLTAEIIMFVRVSGFTDEGVVLPEDYQSAPGQTHSVTFALIRWLSAHPDALLRDSQRRPICPPPLDINHALWIYSEENRELMTTTIMNRNLHMYPGKNSQEREHNAKLERRAMFDFVLPQTFEQYVNCTTINTTTDPNFILETITIPF